MPLFDFFKKPEPQTYCCCEGDNCCTPEEAEAEHCCSGDCCTPEEAASDKYVRCDCCAPADKAARSVKVFGGGCKNCHKLLDNTQEALQSLGMDDTAELVTDIAVIAAHGVLSTPALVVDGRVVSAGRVLTPAQAARIIRDVRGE